MPSFSEIQTSLSTRIQSGEYWGSIIGIAVGYYLATGKRAPTAVMVAIPVSSMVGMIVSDVVTVTTTR
jgi:hypothetical protein